MSLESLEPYPWVYCAQPQVLYKEDPDFQAEWREAKLRCEMILIDVLRRHLSLRVTGKSQNSLRDLSKSAYNKHIRKYTSNAEASNSVKNTLHEAENMRLKQNRNKIGMKLDIAKVHMCVFKKYQYSVYLIAFIASTLLASVSSSRSVICALSRDLSCIRLVITRPGWLLPRESSFAVLLLGRLLVEGMSSKG